MQKRIQKRSRSQSKQQDDRHRYEHWLIDHQVYFITARCRDRIPAFGSEQAKAVFWDRFEHYTYEFGFILWVSSLLDNHYHTLGYLQKGDALPRMMQRLDGSVAKLVNDLLPARRTPFWLDDQGKQYFDGCIRDEKQSRLAYRSTLTQAVRHGIVRGWRVYPHTHVTVDLESAIRRSHELKAFLEGVPYKRYECPK
jgi:REP element-mobilizing transposase RayT